MKVTNIILISAATAATALTANAQTTFVFEDNTSVIGAALDEQSSGSFTEDGIEITATASTDAFNVTASGFGINQAASGDDTDAFDFTDGASGLTEGFTLSFDQEVILVSFSVSSFGTSDEVTILDGLTTVATITATGLTSLGNYTLSDTSTLTINTTGGSYGNGWSFDSITVSAVPEPGTFALLSGCFGLIFVMLKRRNA